MIFSDSYILNKEFRNNMRKNSPLNNQKRHNNLKNQQIGRYFITTVIRHQSILSTSKYRSPNGLSIVRRHLCNHIILRLMFIAARENIHGAGAPLFFSDIIYGRTPAFLDEMQNSGLYFTIPIIYILCPVKSRERKRAWKISIISNV